MNTRNDLIDAVKSHAYENYERGGWDYVIECLTNDDIARIISKRRSVRGAIAAVKIYADWHCEARQEGESTIW